MRAVEHPQRPLTLGRIVGVQYWTVIEKGGGRDMGKEAGRRRPKGYSDRLEEDIEGISWKEERVGGQDEEYGFPLGDILILPEEIGKTLSES